ncbi:MAG: type I-U CRISPR-associated protein Csb2, partial [Phycisphaeraceae bacterium]
VQAERPKTHFDTDMLVLTHVGGPPLPVVSTLAVTRALRGAIMRHCPQPVPPWVSGHHADGEPGDEADGHLACIPLPFVDHDHADGHLLGVGLVFPRSVPRSERGQVLGPLLINSERQPREIELQLGRLGVWKVIKRDWSEGRRALQPETWTVHPTGEKIWASVTPVVLDRFPKSDRINDRKKWIDEVVRIVQAACRRLGLPKPSVDVDTTCWHRGSARAVGKRRPLRGNDATQAGGATLGEGFAFYPPKGTNASRPQVHVRLAFAERIVGPVLLGAGRYLGYGLCRPLNSEQEAGR